MRIALLTVLVLLVAGCGDGAPVDGTEDGLELPTVGILGDLPPAEGAVVVTVFADGELIVGGKPCTWDGLSKRLVSLAVPPEAKGPERKRIHLKATMTAETIEEDLEEVEEDTEEVPEQEIIAEEPVIRDAEITDDEITDDEIRDTPRVAGMKALSAAEVRALLQPGPRPQEAQGDDGLRNADVLLRIDRRVPWVVVVRLLWKVCEPDVRLTRVFYAATDGETEGAIAVFLPVDSCGRKSFVNAEAVTVRLRAKAGAGDTDARLLAEHILTRKASAQDLVAVHLAAPALTPFGVVFTAVDAAVRAGAGNIEFDGTGMPEESIEALVAAAAEPAAFGWVVRGEPVTLRPKDAPLAAGRRPGYVGTTNMAPLAPELREPILDEDGDEVEDD